MAEQLDPDHGDSLSATPLVWSHAEYVRAVLLYQQALVKLGKVKAESVSIIHEL